MKLLAYEIPGQTVRLRPAPFERRWMDDTHQQFAYRCLPLSIANAHGWEVLCPAAFSASWRGDAATEAITIIPDPGAEPPAVSHFGHGVLTFHIPCVFRTEPGFDLMVQGPVNRPRDGLYPLTGVVETDWAPFTFTVNWIFTRPGAPVRFEQGDPICSLFPIRRELEVVEPEIRPLEDDAELKRQYEAWTVSRNQFNASLKAPGAAAEGPKWQKNYHRGQDAFGKAAGGKAHRTRLRLKPFERIGGPEG